MVGFSFVYLVKNDQHQSFALKQMAIMLPEHEQHFQNETDAHMAVKDCAWIIQLVDWQKKTLSDGKTFGYLLLPFYHTGSVQDWIDRLPAQSLSLRDILKVMIGVCKGLMAFQYDFLSLMIVLMFPF
jgi:hypothetical protein